MWTTDLYKNVKLVYGTILQHNNAQLAYCVLHTTVLRTVCYVLCVKYYCVTYCVLRTVCYVLCVMYCVLRTVCYILCVTYCVLCTVCYVLCVTYCVLRTTCCVLYVTFYCVAYCALHTTVLRTICYICASMIVLLPLFLCNQSAVVLVHLCAMNLQRL